MCKQKHFAPAEQIVEQNHIFREGQDSLGPLAPPGSAPDIRRILREQENTKYFWLRTAPNIPNFSLWRPLSNHNNQDLFADCSPSALPNRCVETLVVHSVHKNNFPLSYLAELTVSRANQHFSQEQTRWSYVVCLLWTIQTFIVTRERSSIHQLRWAASEKTNKSRIAGEELPNATLQLPTRGHKRSSLPR